MKKQLMTTTALVAAGLLATTGSALAQKKAAKPTLSLGGWFEGILGVVDDDDVGTNGVQPHVGIDVQQDSEIHFKGSMTLDNGIRIRTRTELEAQSSNSSDQIDEAYMAISGSFGEVRIGSEDNAAHLLVTPYQGSWATNVGQNLNFDVQDWIDPPSGMDAGAVNRLDLDNDADSEKITYFTPRIEGFQLGVTYMPSFNEGQNGRPERRSAAYWEGWSIGANYNRKFDQVGIGLGAGYLQAHSNQVDASDPKGWGVGAKVSFGGFTVAAGYNREMNLNAEGDAVNSSSEALDFGVKYKMGKNNFSVGYNHVEAEGQRAVDGDDELDSLMASYRRDLGPGVQYRLNFMWADWEGEATGSDDDNEGIAVTTSVRIAF